MISAGDIVDHIWLNAYIYDILILPKISGDIMISRESWTAVALFSLLKLCEIAKEGVKGADPLLTQIPRSVEVFYQECDVRVEALVAMVMRL